MTGVSLECAKAVTTTFGTYCVADFLSNFIQHPTQKMDYGILNSIISRKTNTKIWGTRLEHILGVAATLAITDHGSAALFEQYLGKAISFEATPAAFVAHTFLFIFVGVAAFVAVGAAFNPANAGNRMAAFKEDVYSTYVGTNSAWFVQSNYPSLYY